MKIGNVGSKMKMTVVQGFWALKSVALPFGCLHYCALPTCNQWVFGCMHLRKSPRTPV